MYARRIKCRHQRWGFVFRPPKDWNWANCREHAYTLSLSHTSLTRSHSSHNSLIKRHLLDSVTSRGFAAGGIYSGLHGRLWMCLKSCQLRVYSSEGDGRNASEEKHIPIKDGNNIDKGKIWREKSSEVVRHSDAHAQLGEQDQQEWIANVKLAIEIKKKESPFLTRREKFKNEFLRRIVPWEKISVSWETFPYYLQYLLLAHIFNNDHI